MIWKIALAGRDKDGDGNSYLRWHGTGMNSAQILSEADHGDL